MREIIQKQQSIMIDHQTVERIKEAANIVDVVSEFVTLKKAGANFKGLCPFHNEKTPSFVVSPARGTCHCFGCGKGGNAISFIMEHEQMTYPEALRWLAGKYHIDIQERELTDEEKREQSERESMFIVNEWAADYFEDLLHNHPDGSAIGMQYFRSRGIRDDIVRKFRLGYDLSDRKALARSAAARGYNTEFLLKTGICYKNDQEDYIDRYAGRVMFPWIGVSGKVVGFGGRLLDARTKGVSQKYVNSPDSEIYHKDHELYGIFQGKKAIAREDRVYMVEGYTDVIAMHQCGIENVVANSGTALSVHQIHTLHRFTSNITLLYDGDEAGIHAALRGTDMLLAEGMNLKVLLLPDGDDPDSFARKHTAADFRDYIEKNQTDFIQFKTRLLLDGQRDPLKRSEAINSIVRSISVIQNQILRDTYLHDCASAMGMSEGTLINTMNQFIRNSRQDKAASPAPPRPVNATMSLQNAPSRPGVEQMLAAIIIRHGETVIFRQVEDDEGHLIDLNVAQYIDYNLSVDGLSFETPLFNTILQEAVDHSGDPGFKAETYFAHHDNIEISQLATSVGMDRYELLSEQKGKGQEDEDLAPELVEAREADREERIRKETDHLLNDFRMDLLDRQLKDIQQQIKAAADNTEKLMQLMAQYKKLHQMRSELARMLGKNIQ